MRETTARERFAAAERRYAETFEKHLDNGVEFTSRNVYIGPEVEIAGKGEDEPEAVDALVELANSKFAEA